MDSNPLLAMLKQAASGPPATPPTPSGHPAHSVSPPSSAAVSPPPPSLVQPVSLDDLFKSISQPRSASVSAAAATQQHQQHQQHQQVPGAPGAFPASSAPGPPGAPQHQAKLLGMLSLGVGAPGTASPGSSSEGRPSSGVPVGEAERKNSLLNVLKSPVAAPAAALTEPVITHPTQLLSPVLSPTPAHAAPAPVPSPTHSAATPAMAKSMFDFVSPFDAFDPKPARSVSGSVASASAVGTAPASPTKLPSAAAASATTTTTNGNGPSPIPVPPTAAQAIYSPPQVLSPGLPPQHQTLPAVAQLDQVRSRSPATRAPKAHGRKASASSSAPAPAPVVSATAAPEAPAAVPTPHPTSAPSSAGKKGDLRLPWLVSKVVKNVDGTGPKPLHAGPIVIDLSKTSTDVLVNMPGTVEVTPTTIMRAENVGFHRGRTVGATKGWVAYTLTRGRVRLIDRTSGARTVIQLDETGPIIDLAATAEGLAVVGADGAVYVFRVPVSWDRDDPPCPLIFYLAPLAPNSVPETLGDVNHVEWVRRGGEDEFPSLAIGGTEGVIIVRPSAYDGKPEIDARELLTSSKVLKTSGVLVSFCLNATHQAIGLLSSSGYFCLYSVANLNRVWNRQLPSGAANLTPCSARFCEANILVGRANNTHFDLVQITVELAILTSIKLVAPPPSPPALHFAHAEYDAERGALIIAPFARGSVYALRYALKSQPPLRGVVADASGVTAFDSVAEFPLDSVLSFVVGGADDVELLYATPTGISQASIDKSVFVAKVPEVKKKEKEKKERKEKEKEKAAPAPLQATRDVETSAPTTAPSSPPAVLVPVPPIGAPAPTAAAATTAGAGGVTPDELAKALKKTEDKLSNLIKQTVSHELKSIGSRLDSNRDIAPQVSAAVGEHLRHHLPSIISDELKRVPIQAEVRAAVSEHSQAAIQQSLQGLSRDLERSIAPVVPRTIATVVQPAVHHAVHDAVKTILVPAISTATTRVYDQLVADLKSEMLHIRKDINNDQGDALKATNSVIRDMSGSVSELQKQVMALSEQVRSLSGQLERAQAAPAAAATPVVAPPATAAAHPHPALSILSPPPAPAAVPIPAAAPATPAQVPQSAPARALEDAFLDALQRQTTGATLQLVHDNAPRTEQILPLPPAHSPLSQAVLLTLVHRLTLALGELPPHDPLFATAVQWERRAAMLLDNHDKSTAGYLPRVLGVVIPALADVLGRLSHMPDHVSHAYANMLRGALEELKSKAPRV